MTTRNIAAARDAVNRLASTLDSSEQFDESLAVQYQRAKKALAVNFQEMALSSLPRHEFPLDAVKLEVKDRMRDLFGGRVDSSLLQIRRYTTPHPDLYALLASQLGAPVPGWRLRLLSGDKVHTERRTRELRDLGLAIATGETDDEATYTLLRMQPDLDYAAAFQLRENALKSRKIDASTRSYCISLAENAATLPERRAK